MATHESQERSYPEPDSKSQERGYLMPDSEPKERSNPEPGIASKERSNPMPAGESKEKSNPMPDSESKEKSNPEPDSEPKERSNPMPDSASKERSYPTTVRISKEMKRYNYLCGEIEAAYHALSLKLGLSDSAMRILYAVCDNGEGCRLQNISVYTGLSKQTINSAMRKLESEGIVYLEAFNAKSKKVYFTEKGRKLAERTAYRMIQIEEEIFASWEKADVLKYLRLTENYLVSLREKTEQLQCEKKL